METLDQSSSNVHPGRRHKLWPPISWPPWGGDEPTKENKTEKATRLAESVIKLEKGLAKASLDLDILFQDPVYTYNPMTFDNFTNHLPEIDFAGYLSTFAPRDFPETVIVTYPPYLHSLSTLIQDTEAEVMEAYFVSRVALGFADLLSHDTEVWKTKRTLDELLRGLKKGAVEPRDDFCRTSVESAMGFGAGRFFVEETFPGKSQEKAVKVIDGTSLPP